MTATTPAEAAASGAPRVELAPGVLLGAAAYPQAASVLEPAIVALVAKLHRGLDPARRDLLAERTERQEAWDRGGLPGPVAHPAGAAVRGDWQVRELPADLRRRRVEITGPISSAKMVLNMLSRNADGHRADCAMLDFEDSMKPAWHNVIQGFTNLAGAVDGSLALETSAKRYRLDPADRPLIMVRCRGLHLDEANLEVDGVPVCGGLLEVATCAALTAHGLIEQGRTPKFYVPKVEHYREARWWNELFSAVESELGLGAGSLRTTFLIETLPAAFQIEEILYELRDRVAGLNVGRWDKIFSDIKVCKESPDRVLADRATLTMQKPWLESYARGLVSACHRHGAFAMGGMAAFTPGGTEALRADQTAKVVADKEWEAALGHDGCWVSHPYFIGPAMRPFHSDHQLDRLPEPPDPDELLPIGGGPRTVGGLRTNIRVGIAYLEGWHRDVGCVAWDDLMEDLATLEISRAQTWQWLRHKVTLDDGTPVTRKLVESIFASELDRILDELQAGAGEPAARSFSRAAASAAELFCERRFRPFLTSTSEVARATAAGTNNG